MFSSYEGENNNSLTSRFNTNTSHPLIPNSQNYIYYHKFVSIHSEDRNILKYPESSEFEIEMPEDILNVVSLRLSEWTFPCNYNTFSLLNGNVSMTFKINNPYNPILNGITDILSLKIFEFLNINKDNNYAIIIQDGFYNPVQIVNELTNKFNNIVTIQLEVYFIEKINDPNLSPLEKAEYIDALNLLNAPGGSYANFVIVYNSVSQKIWFGNISDGFILTNDTQVIRSKLIDDFICITKQQAPDFSDWGLPGNLGLSRLNNESVNSITAGNFTESAYYKGIIVPRFYFGSYVSGDNGFWLLPNPKLPNSKVNWIQAPYKINFMGPSHIYMELEGQNCIDETQPYNVSDFTVKTNGTNGIVNSSFAKIPIPTTPLSQWFDRESLPYKFYYPPAERIRKLKIKLRYHNGQLVNFGVFNYSFTIEFKLLLPNINREYNGKHY